MKTAKAKSFNALDVRTVNQKKKLSQAIRIEAAHKYSSIEEFVVAEHLGITRKEDDFYLRYTEVRLGNNYNQTQTNANIELYRQALNSLKHNCNFILAMLEFKAFEVDAKDYAKIHIITKSGMSIKANYNFSSKILSSRSCEKKSHTLKIEHIPHILENYEKIFNNIQKYVENDLTINSSGKEEFQQLVKDKEHIMKKVNLLINGLRENKFNISTFANAICEGDIAKTEHTIAKPLVIAKNNDKLDLHCFDIHFNSRAKINENNSYIKQYCEAIQTLKHNNEFISAIFKFKDFKIDEDTIKIVTTSNKSVKATYNYNPKVASSCREHNKRSQPIAIEDLANVLDEYNQIFAHIEKCINRNISEYDQDELNRLVKDKENTLEKSAMLIEALQNNEYDLTPFANAINKTLINESDLTV